MRPRVIQGAGGLVPDLAKAFDGLLGVLFGEVLRAGQALDQREETPLSPYFAVRNI